MMDNQDYCDMTLVGFAFVAFLVAGAIVFEIIG